MNTSQDNRMEKLISLAKRRGFIYQGSEIYGGLAGTWDYAPLGVALKKNIENLWWKRFVLDREDVYGMDASILMNQNVWKASGHVDTFTDPLVEDKKTGKRFRADNLLEEAGVDVKGMTLEGMNAVIKEKKILSPDGNPLGEVRRFQMMLSTHVGPVADAESVTYLRPETAGGMFVNFKNVLDSFHPKLPFGMAQIGKAFRNEIAPRDFIFRVRELEQMEIEYFVRPENWRPVFDGFLQEQRAFLEQDLGLTSSKIHQVEIPEADRAHYSKHSVDHEFDFPFGQKELLGCAYRTDYDLKNHTEASGTSLTYFDEESKERFFPHCIEPTFGLGRLLLAVFSDAYREDVVEGEPRVYLAFSPRVAPVKVAVFPLLKNKPELVSKAREVFSTLKKEFGAVLYDEAGSIGKRYRRQDEIGTPFCVTVDFDTIEKNEGVTVRFRDTGVQERVSLEKLSEYLREKLS